MTLSDLAKRAVGAFRGGRLVSTLKRIRVKARYDAAQSTIENRKHWAAADSLSADAALSPSIRSILRSRSRYEISNNTYAKGIVSTLANYVIGTGARLQMQTDDSDLNREIESKYAEWEDAAGVSEKLRLMRESESASGDCFGILATNPRLKSPVQLDIRVIEADQVATPLDQLILATSKISDGVVFDEFDNPIEYQVLKRHPGSLATMGGFLLDDFQTIPVESMIHLFKKERPGQSRGIPELTSALPLFALLRRYTLAVLGSAEQAALASGVIYTDAAGEEQASVETFDTVPLERGSWLTMPAGWKIGQIKAEQPTTMYKEFKREILNEIARCINMPFNIAAGNSSDYNYASGRLDHQSFFRSIAVDRDRIVKIALDKIFDAWIQEAVLIEDYLPPKARLLTSKFPHQWMWDGFEHVDPAKEANAQQIRLQNHSTTLADEYAKVGSDWETKIRQRARELDLMRELNMPLPSSKDGREVDRQERVDEVIEEANAFA